MADRQAEMISGMLKSSARADPFIFNQNRANEVHTPLFTVYLAGKTATPSGEVLPES
ncbi:hypothetical protein [Serratia aquatilis]|uniref:Uncharacterized protein n=1 Tax=Serratia aquatilis TaxID=1737515 RepID=A0ABV6EJ63_9GAMM